MKMRKILATLAAAVVACSAMVTSAFAADEEKTYHAYFGIQCNGSWAFRNAWTDASYGAETDFFKDITANDASVGAKVVDAEVTGDGTYTVSVSGYDFKTNGATGLNLLFVSTDIPLSANAKVTDVVAKIDGKEVVNNKDGFQSPDDKDYVNIMMYNAWNDDLNALNGKVNEDANFAPTDTVEITFTISGLNAPAASTEEKPADSEAEKPADDNTNKNPGTGATAGLALAGLALAGVAVVATKKSK